MGDLMEKTQTPLSEQRKAQLQAEHIDLMRKIQAGNEESGDMERVSAIAAELNGEEIIPVVRDTRSAQDIATAARNEEEQHGVK
jgi:hypothetical protein